MKRAALLLYLFLAFAIRVISQPDYGLWNEFSLEKDFSKKFSLELQEEFRFDQSLSHFDVFHSSIGANYKPIKPVKLSFAYRFSANQTLENEVSFRHRLALDASYRLSFNNLKFSCRSRIQSEVKNFNSSKNGKTPSWEWRNRLTVEYSIKRFSPYVGAEVYYQISDARETEFNNTWTKKRYRLGVDYKINKRNDIGVYFLLQRGIDPDYPDEVNIVGVTYSINL
ncbi:MAG TPA: DUF2490 domain-containing protein [Tenuifilaceae bacterium]|nr:DUF2490 domain-containing protein [Tenuifilaceae bacterium]HPJ45569.1 DUF2490 domain-containing protein [Tenuifilaceae bacterium]HPQ33675.1 DUF2490 domain-containing protein [Tenuifilaceae bacterium]